MFDVIDTHQGLPHRIRRQHVYEDCMTLYSKNLDRILKEFPFRITYVREKAVDTGGVCRDLFSAFWESAYIHAFDGGNLLVPAVYPGTDMANLPVLGTIMSHGFLASGFLPIRVAFPVVAAILLGPSIEVPDTVIMDSFVDYISSYEGGILREALQIARSATSSYMEDLQGKLIEILSRFECRQIPTPNNIQQLIIGVARHEFLVKPLGALYALHSGVPRVHQGFWSQFSLQELFALYAALNATPAIVLDRIEEPEQSNSAQMRIFSHLIRFIGNMKQEELRCFLRFVTGSSVMIDKSIKVNFNSLQGLARRPISHTCSCLLELSTSYSSFLEFEQEFSVVLTSEDAWPMDAV